LPSLTEIIDLGLFDVLRCRREGGIAAKEWSVVQIAGYKPKIYALQKQLVFEACMIMSVMN
jgi:hypothetical protein